MFKFGLILLIVATFAASSVHSSLMQKLTDWMEADMRGCEHVQKKLEDLSIRQVANPVIECQFACAEDKLTFIPGNQKYAGSTVLCCCEPAAEIDSKEAPEEKGELADVAADLD